MFRTKQGCQFKHFWRFSEKSESGTNHHSRKFQDFYQHEALGAIFDLVCRIQGRFLGSNNDRRPILMNYDPMPSGVILGEHV